MLSSFSAAFLGSAALKEGQFHILGTLIGVLTVAVGNNGLAMIGAPIFTQYVFSDRSLSWRSRSVALDAAMRGI